MQGTIDIHFSELFADTVRVHGRAWAQQYYRMSAWEFAFWFNAMEARNAL